MAKECKGKGGEGGSGSGFQGGIKGGVRWGQEGEDDDPDERRINRAQGLVESYIKFVATLRVVEH